MWGWLVRALAWAGQIAAGWMFSDIYNESKRSDQIADANQIPRETFFQKVTGWFANRGLTVVLIVGAGVVIYFVFDLIKGFFAKFRR